MADRRNRRSNAGGRRQQGNRNMRNRGRSQQPQGNNNAAMVFVVIAILVAGGGIAGAIVYSGSTPEPKKEVIKDTRQHQQLVIQAKQRIEAELPLLKECMVYMANSWRDWAGRGGDPDMAVERVYDAFRQAGYDKKLVAANSAVEAFVNETKKAEEVDARLHNKLMELYGNWRRAYTTITEPQGQSSLSFDQALGETDGKFRTIIGELDLLIQQAPQL